MGGRGAPRRKRWSYPVVGDVPAHARAHQVDGPVWENSAVRQIRRLVSTVAAAAWLLPLMSVTPACSLTTAACEVAGRHPALNQLPASPAGVTLVEEFTTPAVACESDGSTVRLLTAHDAGSEVLLERFVATLLGMRGWSRSSRFVPIVEVASPSRHLLVEVITAEDEVGLESENAAYQPRFKFDSVPVRPTSLPSPLPLDNTMEAFVRQPVTGRPPAVIVMIHWCGGQEPCA